MKRSLFIVISLLTLFGCERQPFAAERTAECEAKALIRTLAANPTVRSVKDSRKVREKLMSLSGKNRRTSLWKEWRDALLEIPVERLSPSDRYGVIRESCDLLDWSVVGALWDIGGNYEDVWNLRFKTLDRLDAHVEKLRLLCHNEARSIDELCERWRSYLALSEFREQVVENHERFDFDERGKSSDMGKMDAIRKRFEQRIGRPVRKREEITRLGFYAKQARARIQKERDAALKKTASRE